jgi:CheY-like chemotaxis protein
MLSVMIIDDEEEILNITRLFLERFGDMEVSTLKSAKEALALMKNHSFDAIIVDYDLPEINGIEFLKIIRSKGDTTPVIIFTGVGGEYAAIEALNNGANFFLKKGEDINPQLRDMVHMVRRAVDGMVVGKGLGNTQKILSDVVGFFPEPAFAIDREGKVISWNAEIAAITGIDQKDMIGRKEYEYALPFFGRRAPMLIDLIFQDEKTIRQHNYSIVAHEQGTLIGWIKITGTDGKERVWWMKAMPLYDAKGIFIGAIGAVRDITDLLGTELLKQPAPVEVEAKGSAKMEPAARGQGKMFDRILGKAKSQYQEGLRLYYREGRFEDAIVAFDHALEINPSLAFAWHDRGICLRELGRDEEGLASIEKALDLSPGNEEILFNRAETLKKIGILQGDRKILEQAVNAYNEVLEKNPALADAWNNLGICTKGQGKDELSRQYFERARDLKRFNKDQFHKRNLESLF